MRPAPFFLLTLGAALSCAPLAAQATIPIPLNYNFNGIVHAGEPGLPDAPNGYRSISDRGLDFTAGVPQDALLTPYQIVSTANTLDIVHLGNRNTVDGGNRAFDATPNGDDIGIQPTWLTTVDQSGPQTTDLTANPVPIGPNAAFRLIFQISNGGGSFDVTLNFFNGGMVTRTVSGGDWFGGAYAGTENTDSAIPGANLSITERTIDLSSFGGEVIQSVSFSNASNTNGGIAILAARIDFQVPQNVIRVPLNYNFNGIVHAGESALPDDPNGFRSISDRALDFTAGVPTGTILDGYRIVDQPGQLDIVHLGNRNTVDGGSKPFDPVANGDDLGIQPAWLPNPDQTGPQVTMITNPILLDSNSQAQVLFQISNGGGLFDVTFGFLDGTSTTATLSGGDWFGGGFAGTANIDSGLPGANLNLVEQTVMLGGSAGKFLNEIRFENPSNTNAGYAILAANVSGCDVPGSVANLGGSNGPTLATTSSAQIGAQVDLQVSGAAPSSTGFLLFGGQIGTTPLRSVLRRCNGGGILVAVPSIADIPANTDASGAFSLVVPGPTDPRVCGVTLVIQHVGLDPSQTCDVTLSNGLGLTFGY